MTDQPPPTFKSTAGALSHAVTELTRIAGAGVTTAEALIQVATEMRGEATTAYEAGQWLYDLAVETVDVCETFLPEQTYSEITRLRERFAVLGFTLPAPQSFAISPELRTQLQSIAALHELYAGPRIEAVTVLVQQVEDFRSACVENLNQDDPVLDELLALSAEMLNVLTRSATFGTLETRDKLRILAARSHERRANAEHGRPHFKKLTDVATDVTVHFPQPETIALQFPALGTVVPTDPPELESPSDGG